VNTRTSRLLAFASCVLALCGTANAQLSFGWRRFCNLQATRDTTAFPEPNGNLLISGLYDNATTTHLHATELGPYGDVLHQYGLTLPHYASLAGALKDSGGNILVIAVDGKIVRLYKLSPTGALIKQASVPPASPTWSNSVLAIKLDSANSLHLAIKFGVGGGIGWQLDNMVFDQNLLKVHDYSDPQINPLKCSFDSDLWLYASGQENGSVSGSRAVAQWRSRVRYRRIQYEQQRCLHRIFAFLEARHQSRQSVAGYHHLSVHERTSNFFKL
jgi:hypothetical protein